MNTAFELKTVPPKGWQDIGIENSFYRELKRGPQYLCRYCGKINGPGLPKIHKTGCPTQPQNAPTKP
jgi:hypothetical protein